MKSGVYIKTSAASTTSFEELERSKVRVKFFQSGKPQQISPPDNNLGFYDFEQSLLSDYLSNDINNISDNTMTATAVLPTYDRQIRRLLGPKGIF
ncbi:hypothetical protein Bhyg_11805 [Pseudolycoriella hygida]|uniref:Uncharacterized protein n=1 Tax=Pseudolycoriella hygida TaxID=35572 RepID=A0A9Q0MW64_9DIPT|nr:hypothetical protein Bhyg_11805 [Pseudolycoriella hygida]